MRRILFVCTGNTCRSPMAEAMFRTRITDGTVEVRSAGVAAYDGQSASPHAQQILLEKGIPHAHASKRLDAGLADWADLILTMTGHHKMLVRQFFPQAAEKVYTLTEYVGYQEQDIQDPFGGGLDTYRQCAAQIEHLLDRLEQKLRQLPLT